METNEFWSSDECYRANLSANIVEQLINLCKESGKRETGGILVGYYDLSGPPGRIVVTDLRLADDSQSGRNWFVRGRSGTNPWLEELWLVGRYYLGEWHFHPDGDVAPSFTDRQEMFAIAGRRSYKCPEPLLIIIARGLHKRWRIGVHLFVKGEPKPINLGSQHLKLQPKPNL